MVTRNFPPVRGGMERLLHHVYLELSGGFRMALVGPRGCGEFALPGLPVAGCSLTPIGAFLLCLQWKAVRLATSFKPDLVIAGSGVAAPAALYAARKVGARAACYLHGLDVIVDSVLYRRLFLPAVRRCDVLIANSRYTAGLAARAGMDARKLSVLNPGVDIPPLRSAPAPSLFRDAIGARGRRLLLSVGRIHPRKGLAEFTERIMPQLVARFPDVLLAIVGDEPKTALRRASGEKLRVLDAARRSGVDAHVVFTGSVDQGVLDAAYAESDLLVFPVVDLPGDAEGFGMVALEAAAHGLPAVAFAVGGVPEAVEHSVSGYLVPAGDYAGFARAVGRCLAGEEPFSPERCREYALRFSWKRFGEKLRKICAEALR